MFSSIQMFPDVSRRGTTSRPPAILRSSNSSRRGSTGLRNVATWNGAPREWPRSGSIRIAHTLNTLPGLPRFDVKYSSVPSADHRGLPSKAVPSVTWTNGSPPSKSPTYRVDDFSDFGTALIASHRPPLGEILACQISLPAGVPAIRLGREVAG